MSTVSGLTITNGILWAVQGTNVVFTATTHSAALDTGLVVACLFSTADRTIRVLHNTLLGGYDGGRANVGTDDAIVIFNERGDPRRRQRDQQFL